MFREVNILVDVVLIGDFDFQKIGFKSGKELFIGLFLILIFDCFLFQIGRVHSALLSNNIFQFDKDNNDF